MRTAARTAVFMPGRRRADVQDGEPQPPLARSAGGCGSARSSVCSVRSAAMKLLPRSSSARSYSRASSSRLISRVFDTHSASGIRDHAVAAHADDLRLLVGRAGEQRLDRGVAHDRAEVAVEGARRAAALDVAEHRDAHRLAEPRLEHLPQLLGW